MPQPQQAVLPAVPTLAECLAAAPVPYRASLTPSRTTDPAEAAAFLLEPAYLRSTLDELPTLEKDAFSFLLAAGRAGVPVERCWNYLAERTGQRHRRFEAVVDGLRRRGLVFTGHYEYRTVYFLPADLRQLAWEVLMVPALLKAAIPPDQVQPLPYSATALRDMHLLLSEVANGNINVTNEGQIYRRQQTHLASLWGWPGRVDARGRTAPLEECLAARLDLLTSYGLFSDLFTWHEHSATLDKNAPGWLKAPWARKWVHMLDWLLDRARSWNAEAFSLLECLAAVPAGTWLPLPSPDRRGAETGDPTLTGTFLYKLQYMGLLDLGILKPRHAWPRPAALRATPLGYPCLQALFRDQPLPPPDLPPEEDSFIVAPDFEVVTGSTLRGDLLVALGRLAKLQHADQALVFRLDRASIYNALKAGLTLAQISAFLRKCSRHPLPANVETSIAEWAADYGRVGLAHFYLLRCRDPETARHLEVSPRLSPFIAGKLTPQDLILNTDDFPTLRKLLEKEGYLPRAGVEEITGSDHRNQTGMAKVGAGMGGTFPHKRSEPASPVRLVTSSWPDLNPRR